MGVAVGDSLGLPMEAVSAQRAAKLFKGPVRQRMAVGKGLLSDDTQMATAVAQALTEAGGDAERFARGVAKRLLIWFWTIPPGIGLATIKACLRLSAGFGYARSGVSAQGNGPAMRAVVVGAAFADDEEMRRNWTDACTKVTHTHPIAVSGARIAADAAAYVARGFTDDLSVLLRHDHPDWLWEQGFPEEGPTGYMVYTINAAIDCCAAHPKDPKGALEMAIRLGGDTDSVAAVVGGIMGASGTAVWPEEWTRWIGWPSVGDLREISTGAQKRQPPVRLLCQHALTLLIIIPHIIRRMMPPY